MEPAVRIRLLGPVAVLKDGAEAALPPSKKARALLAYLALTGRPHARSRLCEMFWDVADDPRAGLRWCLSKLRSAVNADGSDAIVADRKNVSFDATSCWTDVLHVRSSIDAGLHTLAEDELRAVAECFRGELLEGQDLPDLHAAQAWLVAARSELRQQNGAILSALVDRLSDRPIDAVPFARQLVTAEPHRAEPRATLYRLLMAAGERAEAEAQLELGTRELEAHGVDARPLHFAARAAPTVESTPIHAPRPAPAADLFGREREMTWLEEAWTAAVGGEGQIRAVSGDAGMGKTRLTAEMMRVAEATGARVLHGGCVDAEGAPVYLPFVEALDELVGSLNETHADRLGTELGLLTRILPGAGDAEVGDTDRYLIFRAAAAVLSAAAEDRGLLIVLEDLHWADAQSLLMLTHLARRISTARILVLVTHRDVSTVHPLCDVLTTLRRESHFAGLRLSRLTESAADALVTHLLGNKACKPGVVAQTEGHPLFIVELVEHLREEDRLDAALDPTALDSAGLPDRIRDVIQHRIARLSEGCRRLLTRASAMPTIRWPVLAAALGTDEDEALDHLDEALEAKLLQVDADARGQDAYEFSHALIQQALYTDLSGPRRARLHLKIAEAIEAFGAADLRPYLAELVHHRGEAVRGGRADSTDAYLDVTMKAGAQAMSLFAFEDAQSFYDKALAFLGDRNDEAARDHRAALYLRRGIALAARSAWFEARDSYKAALEALPDGRDLERGKIHLYSAQSQLWTMNMPGLAEDATAGAALATSTGDKHLRHAALCFSGLRALSAGDLEQTHEIVTGLLEDADLTNPLVMEAVQTVYPQNLYFRGNYDTILAFRKRTEGIGVHSTLYMVVMPVVGMSLGAKGRYVEAEAVFAEVFRFARDNNIGNLHARAVSMATGSPMDTHDDERAQTLAEEAVERAKAAEFPPTVISGKIDLFRLALRRDDLGAANELVGPLETAVAGMKGWHQWIFSIRFQLELAKLAYLEKRYEDALGHVNGGIDLARRVSRRKHVSRGLSLRARIRTAMANRPEGEDDVRAALGLARDMGYPALIARYAAQLLETTEDEALAAEIDEIRTRLAAQLPLEAKERFQRAATQIQRSL